MFGEMATNKLKYINLFPILVFEGIFLSGGVYMWRKPRRQSGYSLTEMSVVLVTIGTLTSIALPKFKDAVERSKAAEAFTYLSSIRASQERHQYIQGTYAATGDFLDMKSRSPKFFKIGTFRSGETGALEDSWRLSLTRKGPSSGYGDYTVTFGQDGFVASESTIVDLPKINPMKFSEED